LKRLLLPPKAFHSQGNLDIEQPERLLAYLQRTERIGAEEQPLIRVLAGGVSNRTVLVERPSGEAWVLKQALAKLRVPGEWLSSPERIHREAQGLRFLESLAPSGTITPLIFEDHEQHLLAMRAVPQPHENWKTVLLAGRLHHDHVQQFGQLLGTIHNRTAENREAEHLFDDRSFFISLRIEPYYVFTARQVPAAASFLNALIQDTYVHRLSLVHGDYSPKNILIHQDRLVLLDHEVIHYGDGAFDVGFSLTHFLSKAHHLIEHRQAFLEAAHHYWQFYVRASIGHGWDSEYESRAARHTLACLLARVAGKSKLEYFNETERARQRQIVLNLITPMPKHIPELINEFGEQLNKTV
jgi:5-methylthioribose kinase